MNRTRSVADQPKRPLSVANARRLAATEMTVDVARLHMSRERIAAVIEYLFTPLSERDELGG